MKDQILSGFDRPDIGNTESLKCAKAALYSLVSSFKGWSMPVDLHDDPSFNTVIFLLSEDHFTIFHAVSRITMSFGSEYVWIQGVKEAFHEDFV